MCSDLKSGEKRKREDGSNMLIHICLYDIDANAIRCYRPVVTATAWRHVPYRYLGPYVLKLHVCRTVILKGKSAVPYRSKIYGYGPEYSCWIDNLANTLNLLP